MIRFGARACSFPWVGRASLPPDVILDELLRTVFVSWNGATDAVGWLLQRALNNLKSFETMDFVPKSGFETVVELNDIDGDWRLVVVDFGSEELGYTTVFGLSHTICLRSLGDVLWDIDMSYL